MDGHVYVGEFVSIVLFFIVGSRLLALSRRTREYPEFQLGLAFVVSGIGLLLYMVPYVFPVDALWTPFIFAGRISFVPVSVMIALFTRSVFRPGEGWATWLVCGIGALHTFGIAGSALNGDWEGYSISNGWFWLEWGGYTLPMAWTGLEALAQYGPARRRVQLGLCGPLVCNRMLLWGLFGVLQVGLSVVVVLQYSDFEAESVFTNGWDVVYGVFSTSSVGMIWLAFFPPSFYRRRISRAARSGPWNQA